MPANYMHGNKITHRFTLSCFPSPKGQFAFAIRLQDLIFSSQCKPHPHGLEIYSPKTHMRNVEQSSEFATKEPSWLHFAPSTWPILILLKYKRF